jgi:hypothetical protein
VELKVAKMSELVKTMIPGMSIYWNAYIPVYIFNSHLSFIFTEDEEESEQQEIPLPNVKSTILAKVRKSHVFFTIPRKIYEQKQTQHNP